MRVENWPRVLFEYVKTNRLRPFVWGEHDCCLFAARWVEVLTGRDMRMPAYDSADTAVRALAAEGGMQAAVTARLGEPLDNPLMAQRGDVALLNLGGRLTLGVVVYGGVMAPGADHLMQVPASEIRGAWRVE